MLVREKVFLLEKKSPTSIEEIIKKKRIRQKPIRVCIPIDWKFTILSLNLLPTFSAKRDAKRIPKNNPRRFRSSLKKPLINPKKIKKVTINKKIISKFKKLIY